MAGFAFPGAGHPALGHAGGVAGRSGCDRRLPGLCRGASAGRRPAAETLHVHTSVRRCGGGSSPTAAGRPRPARWRLVAAHRRWCSVTSTWTSLPPLRLAPSTTSSMRSRWVEPSTTWSSPTPRARFGTGSSAASPPADALRRLPGRAADGPAGTLSSGSRIEVPQDGSVVTANDGVSVVDAIGRDCAPPPRARRMAHLLERSRLWTLRPRDASRRRGRPRQVPAARIGASAAHGRPALRLGPAVSADGEEAALLDTASRDFLVARRCAGTVLALRRPPSQYRDLLTAWFRAADERSQSSLESMCWPPTDPAQFFKTSTFSCKRPSQQQAADQDARSSRVRRFTPLEASRPGLRPQPCRCSSDTKLRASPQFFAPGPPTSSCSRSSRCTHVVPRRP